MRPVAEHKIPLAENERCQMLLRRLRSGPASTIDLQDELPLVHVARQVWELRHWYGLKIKTGRLANNVALYTLLPQDLEPLWRCSSCGAVIPGTKPAVTADTEWTCPVEETRVVFRRIR